MLQRRVSPAPRPSLRGGWSGALPAGGGSEASAARPAEWVARLSATWSNQPTDLPASSPAIAPDRPHRPPPAHTEIIPTPPRRYPNSTPTSHGKKKTTNLTKIVEISAFWDDFIGVIMSHPSPPTILQHYSNDETKDGRLVFRPYTTAPAKQAASRLVKATLHQKVHILTIDLIHCCFICWRRDVFLSGLTRFVWVCSYSVPWRNDLNSKQEPLFPLVRPLYQEGRLAGRIGLSTVVCDDLLGIAIHYRYPLYRFINRYYLWSVFSWSIHRFYKHPK